jgi:diadenosine tetraphosphate (Ap4A) HIT family hydrolase
MFRGRKFRDACVGPSNARGEARVHNRNRTPEQPVMRFVLHPQLAKDSFAIGDAALCRVLLMNDAQYPWCILVPRRAGIREIYELAQADRTQLLEESVALGRAMMRAFDGHKLNVAALGNVVPQLHLHHVVRFEHDAAWPAPVWGRHPPTPYADAERRLLLERLGSHLTAESLLS